MCISSQYLVFTIIVHILYHIRHYPSCVIKQMYEKFDKAFQEKSVFFKKGTFYEASDPRKLENSKPFFKKLKRLTVRLMRKLFRHLTFPHFILNCLIGVLKHSLNSLNSRLRQVMGNRKCINIFGNTAFWWHRTKHLHFFTKNSSQGTVQHPTICCYFELGNLIVLLTQPLFGLIYIFQNLNLILSVS